MEEIDWFYVQLNHWAGVKKEKILMMDHYVLRKPKPLTALQSFLKIDYGSNIVTDQRDASLQ